MSRILPSPIGLVAATVLWLAACGDTTEPDGPPVVDTADSPTTTDSIDTGDSSDSGSVPQPTEGSLRVLTYNVHGLPDALTGDDGEARMRAIAPLLEDFDLVGLQETFDEDKHALLTAEATHEVQTWFSEKVESSRAYGSGLAVLARAPLVEEFTEHYRMCHGLLDASSDCLASKGFQVVRLSVGGAELDLYNTHHEAGGGVEDEATRADQVSQVLDSLATRSAGRAVIFVGDTNLRPSDPPDAEQLARYAEVGLRDACVELDCTEPDHIDRIYVRDSDDLKLQVTDWANEPAFFDADGVPLSDHPAISATIRYDRSSTDRR